MKKLIAILCACVLITLSQWAMAQEETYDFINYTANTLHYDTTSVRMNAFFDKWHRIAKSGQGNLNILHIGSSHVQAGTLPNTIRCRLLVEDNAPVGPRGIIFPYSAAAKCNNPSDYRVHCKEKMLLTRCVYKEHSIPLGLCGIAVTAADSPAEIQIVMNEPRVNYRTTRVVLLGHSYNGVMPRLMTNGEELYPSFVDNRTDRYFFNLTSAVDSFAIVLPCGEGQQFAVNGILLDNDRGGITYHSVGVNGAALDDYLRCRNFVRDLRLVHPDAVVFGIGINDATANPFDTVMFKNKYLQLVDSIKKVNPDCAFIFITNNDSYRKTGRRKYSVNNNGTLAREVFFRLAKETDGAVWDQFEMMGGLKSMEKWRKAGLAQTDRVHFTQAGYRLLGNLFAQSLLDAYNERKKEK